MASDDEMDVNFVSSAPAGAAKKRKKKKKNKQPQPPAAAEEVPATTAAPKAVSAAASAPQKGRNIVRTGPKRTPMLIVEQEADEEGRLAGSKRAAPDEVGASSHLWDTPFQLDDVSVGDESDDPDEDEGDSVEAGAHGSRRGQAAAATKVTKADTAPVAAQAEGTPFAGMELCDVMQARLTADPTSTSGDPVARRGLGYTRPTFVQRSAIPAIMAGGDVMVRAETGSGKTVAFLAPALNDLVRGARHRRRGDGVEVCVLLPTRELASQVADVAERILAPFPALVVCRLGGGEKRKAEKARLRRGCQVLVATPGRLLDHLQKTASLKQALRSMRWLVLDEADQLFQLGFQETLSGIWDALGGESRKWNAIMVSATLKSQLQGFARQALRRPRMVAPRSTAGGAAAAGAGGDDGAGAGGYPTAAPVQLKHYAVPIESKWRLVAMLGLLRALLRGKLQFVNLRAEKILLFVSCRESTEFHHRILTLLRAALLDAPGVDGNGEDQDEDTTETSIVKLHGGMAQPERHAAASQFRTAKRAILVSTDVAARGLDFPFVKAVVQADVPADLEDYVHRSGRTARSGKEGASILLLSPAEMPVLAALERRKVTMKPIRSNAALLRPLGWSEPSVPALEAALGCSLEEESSKHLQTVLGPRSGPAKSSHRRGAEGARLEMAGVRWQLAVESMVTSDEELMALAMRAYNSHVRARACVSKELLRLAPLKSLHLGHLAKCFGLTAKPSEIAGRAKRQRRDEARQDGSDRNRHRLYAMGASRAKGCGDRNHSEFAN